MQLTFQDHVTTALIGPSGSGKSTIIQLINGLTRPSSGTVEVLGKKIDYERLPDLRKKIGYAVQGTGLFPHLTVWENIILLAKLAGWDKLRINERANELIELVELWPSLKERYPYELSGGQQQRVGLCRAMILDPKVLLLDEAFGALDPITRAEIHEEYLRIQRKIDRTVILVTHDLREALKLAKRMVILNEGRVEQHDDCSVILQNPASGFVKDFLDSQLKE
jgi:osmoprotectant transport system ATP-binding protein